MLFCVNQNIVSLSLSYLDVAVVKDIYDFFCQFEIILIVLFVVMKDVCMFVFLNSLVSSSSCSCVLQFVVLNML